MLFSRIFQPQIFGKMNLVYVAQVTLSRLNSLFPASMDFKSSCSYSSLALLLSLLLFSSVACCLFGLPLAFTRSG